MYSSYKQSLRGKYAVDASQFWKDLRQLLPVGADNKSLLVNKRYHKEVNGSKPHIVFFPSLDDCRKCWRETVVQDQEWEFGDEGIEDDVDPVGCEPHAVRHGVCIFYRRLETYRVDPGIFCGGWYVRGR